MYPEFLGKFNPFHRKREDLPRFEQQTKSIFQEVRLDKKATERARRRSRRNMRRGLSDPTSDIFFGAIYPYDRQNPVVIDVDDVTPLEKKGDALLKLHCLGVQSFEKPLDLECKLSELNGGFEEVTRVKFKTLHLGDRIIIRAESASSKSRRKEEKRNKAKKI